MVTVTKHIGTAAGRDYSTIEAFFTASNGVDFTGTTTEWVGVLHMDDDQGFTITSPIVLDNTNTDDTWGRRLTVDSSDEYEPHDDYDSGVQGVRILVKLDPTTTSGNHAGFLHIKRERGFQFTGPVGIFYTCEGDIASGVLSRGLWIGGRDHTFTSLYQTWISQGFANQSFVAMHIEWDSASGATSRPRDISLYNNVIHNDDSTEQTEGIADGIRIVAHPTGICENIHLQHNTIFRAWSVCVRDQSGPGGTGWAGFFNLWNNLAIEGADGAAGGGFAGMFGAGQIVDAHGNLASDGSGLQTPVLPEDPHPTGIELFVDADGRDFRLRHGSIAKDFGDNDSASAISTAVDYSGKQRAGPTWDSGAYEGVAVKAGTQPTITTTQIGHGYLFEHPDPWRRGTRGQLVFANRRERGELHQWPKESYTFDNDLADDPEVLLSSHGWAYVNSGDMVGGAPSTYATPMRYGDMYKLATTGGATNFVGVESGAGNMAPLNEYNCLVVLVSDEWEEDFRLNIRRMSGTPLSHALDFTWTASVPTATPIAGQSYFVRGPFLHSDGHNRWWIQYNWKSDAGDVGQTRSVYLYTDAAVFPNKEIAYGYVRCVTRSSDIELGYCRGDQTLDFFDPATVTDASRRRELVAASGQEWTTRTGLGAAVTHDGAGVVAGAFEKFLRLEHIRVVSTHTADVDRNVVHVNARGVRLDGVVSELTGGPVTPTNEAACLKISGAAKDILVANSVVKSAQAAGASEGVDARDGASGIVANMVAVSIDGEAFKQESAACNVDCKYSIAVNCDTDFDWDEDRQEYNISEDTTALGLGSLVSQSGAAIFKDWPNDDFRLLKTSPALGAGDFGLFLDFGYDIENLQRSSPWDLGVHAGFAFTPLGPAVPWSKKGNRLATIWDVRRIDGNVKRFTDADSPIDYKGQTYTPIEGMGGTAQRWETGLREANQEFLGVIASSSISDADLTAGRYRSALVRARVIDWMYPNAKPGFDRTWKILDTQHTSEGWKANVVGLTSVLGHSIGGFISKDCPYKLGDAKCQAQILTLTQFGKAVTTVDDARYTFRASSIGGGFADDYFNWGELIWETGSNVGIRCVVKDYTQTGRIVSLQVRLPYDVEVGDKFRMEPGDDKLLSTCQGTFSNEDNFGGEPHTPGTDRSLQTPTS